jgi:8-oxo-dGTP diphosphatase
MEVLPLEEHIKRLPRKRIGAAALILNDKNQILIVKPNYKPGWLVPGGSVELFESPREGCIREIKEEIGLDLNDLKFLGMNYVNGPLPNGDKDEGIQCVFFGGILTQEQISKITLQTEELTEFTFVDPDEAYGLLNANLSRRIKEGMNAIKTGIPFYSEYRK